MRRIVTAVLVAAVVLTLSGAMLAGEAPDPAPHAQQAVDPLVRVLQAKGVLSSQEAEALAAVPLTQQRDQLTSILLKKGVISNTDLQGASTFSNERLLTGYSSSAAVRPAVIVETVASPMPQAPAAPKPPAVIPAVAPIRVLPVDSPKREGLVPGFKLGPVGVRPYGFLKMSVVEDSSSPYGTDFPLPGFIADSGPDAAPQFKIKARNSRLGSNFEWLDPSKNLTITGKLEFDFEGNYTAVANRGISTMRSSMPSIRLAYGRLDYAASPSTTVFLVAGQDWVPFGSSTLANSLEGTGLGIAFGSLYERGQQLKGGFTYKFAGNRSPKLLMEAAMVQPSSGNQPFPFPGNNGFLIPAINTNIVNVTFTNCAGPGGTACTGTVSVPQTANNGLGLGDQLAIGERQGPDSNRPEVEGRIALQFQLDKAPGVAPAQLIVSGVHGQRDGITLKGDIPTAFKAAFPRGVRTSSTRWGFSPQIQLPTRWFTLLGSYYQGGDLRWFFAGQILSFYNDTHGLTGSVTAPNIDGSSTQAFNVACPNGGICPQRPIRTRGGFVELGLPLSRLAHANPAGRNAGWTMNLHYGRDDANSNDLRKANANSSRDRSDWAFANLMYKLNNFVTFGYEQSYYSTITDKSAAGTFNATFRGQPARSWHDVREEFSTIFTF